GLQEGDRIVSINGQPTDSFDSMGDAVHAEADQPVELTIVRDGETITVPATIGWALEDSGAARLAPLETGDRITKIGGQPTTTFEAAQRRLSSASEGTIEVEFRRGDHPYR